MILPIRRVLIAPINYDHPQRGLIHAFRYVFGQRNVFEFDYLQAQRCGDTIEEINEEFVNLAITCKPDWIWLQLQETNVITSFTIAQVKTLLPETIITHWTGDYRPTVSPYLASICEATDITFVSSIGQLAAFREAGAEIAKYLQIGIDWEEDVLGIPSWEPPFQVPSVVFIGNHYGGYFPTGTAQRLSVIRAIRDAKIDIGVVGNGWPSDIPVIGQCSVKQQHHIYRKAKIAVNVNHVNDVERYYSDRQLIAMASGTPLVCWNVPGLEWEFRVVGDSFDECIGFTTVDGAVEAITMLLENPDVAARIGYNGRQAVLRRHDWINRIHDALEMVDELRQS